MRIWDMTLAFGAPAFGSFCAAQLVALLAWWLLYFATTRRHAIVLAASSVYVRPRWLPINVLQVLHAHHHAVFSSLAAALALGALAPSNTAVRCALAMAVTLYHLVESSASGRHGDFPLLYISWAWMLLPGAWAHAASFGVMIHFVLSSGAAKLIVGGTAWMGAHTLKAFLDIFRDSKSNPPVSSFLNAEIAARAWLTRLIGLATIALECVLIPGCLILPAAYRPLGAIAMAGMHVGIALSLSLKVWARP